MDIDNLLKGFKQRLSVDDTDSLALSVFFKRVKDSCWTV